MSPIREGETSYQPGVYAGPAGLRLDVVEILESQGIEPTEDAQESAARGFLKCANELNLPATVLTDRRR